MSKGFIRCVKCGKKLMRRRPNGLWSFAFGHFSGNTKVVIGDREIEIGSTVQMEIFGSIKMRCIRRSCRLEHPNFWNVLTFFPPNTERQSIGNGRTPANNKD